MTTKRRGRLMPLFLFGALAACQVHGPDPIAVEADRARWQAVRAVTADASIDAQEAAALAELLTAWDAKLIADEAAIAKPQARRDQLTDLIRVYGNAAVTVALGEGGIQARAKAEAPELFALADRDGSGTLSLEEVLSLDPASPVFAIVVAHTVARLVRR